MQNIAKTAMATSKYVLINLTLRARMMIGAVSDDIESNEEVREGCESPFDRESALAMGLFAALICDLRGFFYSREAVKARPTPKASASVHSSRE